MIRSFLANEVDEHLCREVARLQQQVKQQLPDDPARHSRIQWVQPSNIHLTLKFLGNTDERSVEPLREAISHCTAAHHAIHIPLERIGVFPRLQQPRVLWVGPSQRWEQGEDLTRLTSLHRAVEECCRSFGFAPEGRPLSPHLTLARIKDGERHVGQGLARNGLLEQPINLGTLLIDAIVLMKSDLRPTGSVYTKLWEVRLGER
ncbi:MAG: RNA 2',3'-cyclic phosphodiesterase [Nitrospiraceae bacterium]